MRLAVLAIALAGCGLNASGLDGSPGDAGGGDSCRAALSFDPPIPIAGPATTLRVASQVTDVPGVLEYHWQAWLDGAPIGFTPAQADGSQIVILASAPGVYRVDLDITGAAVPCSTVTASINVGAPGAHSAVMRLRVVPAASVAAPPLERLVEVDGGSNASLGIVALDRGTLATAQVVGQGGGAPAYVRFSPDGAPGAVVEAFADASGNLSARLRPEPHTVTIIPSAAGIAPRRIPGWSPASHQLAVDAGAAITGTVRDPANAAVAGAKVQLRLGRSATFDGVPSTLATTAADGSFTVRAVTGIAGDVVVEVTPAAASELPRLLATSTAPDLSAPLVIKYSLGRTSLAGTRILRQGSPVPGAKLMVVGALGAVGSVTPGTWATTGEARIAITADAAGKLPGALVPAAALSAVITVGAGDLAVAAFDATAGPPASLDAPAMQPFTTVALDPGGVVLGGAVLELAPTGALELAGVPGGHLVAGPSGTVTSALVAGGRYDLRFRDPGGRAAPLVVAARGAASVAASYHLPAAVTLTGTVLLDGMQPLAGAAVQLLCEACTGVERDRAISESSTDAAGRFALAAPDPGTM